jgi:hypothetical protein
MAIPRSIPQEFKILGNGHSMVILGLVILGSVLGMIILRLVEAQLQVFPKSGKIIGAWVPS